MSSLNTVIYLCKEVFDENSQPTQIEIEEQASRLGIDIVKEIHLLSIAKQCLLEPLPVDWFPCYIEKENKYFYYNKLSKISQWEHPLDEYYRQIVEKTRSEDCSTGQDISLNTILDEENLLDTTMYHHTKNSNYEKKAVAEKRTVRFKTPIEESLDLDDSEENMKFLGPIKLNTPFTNTSSSLHNLPQFSTTNTYDLRNTSNRSVLSKYNILPSKKELSKKSELDENIKKTNYEDSSTNLDYTTGKENLRKIDITLTESSDRSESTSSEFQTDHMNSDYEGNDQKEKDNIVTSVQLNKRHEKIDTVDDDGKSAIDNINEFQSIETEKLYNVKKDDLVSDSGNSTAKDSKIIQSSITSSSLSATKSKMAKITQRFPLNQISNEIKLFKRKPIISDEDIFDLKSNSVKSKIESGNNFENEKLKLLDDTHIKVEIEKHCDLMKNKLEDTIKTNQNILKEELIKNIDEVIQKQHDNFQKHVEERHNELFSKNELQLKNIIKNVYQNISTHRIDYNNIRKKIQHCSNELNDALKLINEISSTNKTEHNTNLCPNKCTVSCQTENITNPCQKQSVKEYIYPVESSSMQSMLNNPYDVNTKYANYLDQAKISEDLCSNYLTSYSQQLNYSPLHILSQQELKVKAAEQNICRLIDTFNNFKYDNINNIPNNTNISDEYKFTNIYQALTPKQIAYNRTKHLREWLYNTDLKNKNN